MRWRMVLVVCALWLLAARVQAQDSALKSINRHVKHELSASRADEAQNGPWPGLQQGSVHPRQLQVDAHEQTRELQQEDDDAEPGPSPPPPLTWDSYKFLLPLSNRQDGLLYKGSATRLRSKLLAWTKGANLTIAAAGASITVGSGVIEGKGLTYLGRLGALLNGLSSKAGAGAVHLVNAGMPGVTSMFMSVCVRMAVPDHADIVLVEFASNDVPEKMVGNSEHRRAFERLLRKLLALPSRPAVVLLNTYPYIAAHARYWLHVESSYVDLATYYRLPLLSVKACCYHLMTEGAKGFMVDQWRRPQYEQHMQQQQQLMMQHQQLQPEQQEQQEQQHQQQLHQAQLQEQRAASELFFWDRVHPSGLSGHKAMAELTWHLLQEVLRDATAEPPTSAQVAAASRLPAPMLPGNYQSLRDSCMVNAKFKTLVSEATGYDWVDDAKPDAPRPKYGYASAVPGSRLLLKFSTKASAGDSNGTVVVELAHLKSYQNMGTGHVRCESGCECEDSSFDGHHQSRTSQALLHMFKASQADRCVVSVTVGSETSSGGHRVKVVGVIVSEEGGSEERHSGVCSGIC